MSDESQLVEEVNSDLLDDELIKVVVYESDKVIYQNEIATKLINPYEFDASRFLPNIKTMSLDRFFSIASGLISKAQERAGVKEEKRVILTEEYPPDPFESYGDEVVAYRVLKREPALMNTKGTARPQRRSTYYYDLVEATLPSKVLVVEARPLDHLIEFTCWGKSNKLANARATWLEKLFVNHSWAFEVHGVERFYFKNRGPDTYTTTGGQRLFYRPVNFFVRFREFEVKSHPRIKEMIIEAGGS